MKEKTLGVGKTEEIKASEAKRNYHLRNRNIALVVTGIGYVMLSTFLYNKNHGILTELSGLGTVGGLLGALYSQAKKEEYEEQLESLFS